MYGVQSFRSYNGDAMQGDHNPMSTNKGLPKNQSCDHHFSPGVPSPLSRSSSRRSTTPLRSTSSRKNPDVNGFPRSLSRNSSRSTTPIMFSNSTGIIKPPPIEKQLECTLEELCYGCTKKIKITRDVITNTGQIIQEEEMLTIKVKPGWKKGTKVTFEGMGNEKPGTLPADVTFVIAEKRHPLFRREGDDLELAVEIPLVKALTGCSLSVPLLGGGKMNLTVDEIIHPGFHRLIASQGMPVSSKEHGKRGNLKVVFLIGFPTQLTEEQRLDILSIL
ncbi:dnaJ homolog subfamily B member 13-like [Carica papaya]|uniref:dnaJ homolog subfamily B member 13-like n=1 Tax=Carica papaya TaxID=3649 RepID=UPI000B8CD08A|nr:dnaJ homolog subfamily B member 13-like [Carica papaya]